MHDDLERGGHVVEDGANPLTPADGQPVSGEQQLGLERGDLTERPGPVQRVALHLLGVSRVREHPDHQVADARGAARRDPRPRVVVGLAPGVVQLEVQVADLQVHPFLVRERRAHPVAGEAGPLVATGQPGASELTSVDDRVVAVGQVVAVEALGHQLVADDRGTPVAAIVGVGHDGARPAHVVDVTVGVHQRVDRVGPPAPHGLHDRRPERPQAGVEEHEAVTRVERHDVGEGLDDGDAVGHLGQLEG